MKLHNSQTSQSADGCCFGVHYHMKLHNSQTRLLSLSGLFTFTTIWNYITLKQPYISSLWSSSFTTIWNYITLKQTDVDTFSAISFTTIWNYITLKLCGAGNALVKYVHYHMKLHNSQTVCRINSKTRIVHYHMKLHNSQTGRQVWARAQHVHYHMKLHNSQTSIFKSMPTTASISNDSQHYYINELCTCLYLIYIY